MSLKFFPTVKSSVPNRYLIYMLALVCMAMLGSKQMYAQITLSDIHAKYIANNKMLLSKPVAIGWTKTEAASPEYVKIIEPQIKKIATLKRSLVCENAKSRAESILGSLKSQQLQLSETSFKSYLLQSCTNGVVLGMSKDDDAFFDSQMQLSATIQDFEMAVLILPSDQKMWAVLAYAADPRTSLLEFVSSMIVSQDKHLPVGNLDGILAELGPGLSRYSKAFSSWTELVFPENFDVEKLTDIEIVQNGTLVSATFCTPVTNYGLGMEQGNLIKAEFDLSKGALPKTIYRTRFIEKEGKRYDAFAKSFATEEYTFEIGEHHDAFYIKQATFNHWYPSSQTSWETMRSQIVDDEKWLNHPIEIAKTPFPKDSEKVKVQTVEIKTLEVSTWKPKDKERLFSMDKIPQGKRHIDFRDVYPPKK